MLQFLFLQNKENGQENEEYDDSRHDKTSFQGSHKNERMESSFQQF